MIVSFKFYVMNFVDFVLNCYSHITSHLYQVFASFTYYTSYSLLNIVHVIVCVFGLTNQVCKYFEFFYKTDLMLKILWKIFDDLCKVVIYNYVLCWLYSMTKSVVIALIFFLVFCGILLYWV